MKPEIIIENGVRSYGTNELGLITLKLTPFRTSGWPDRLFLGPGARVLFVEFKAPRKQPRRRQGLIHEQLRRLGFRVETIDSVARGRDLLRGFFQDKEVQEPDQDPDQATGRSGDPAG